MAKVAFIGGGSFGTALAIALAQKKIQISIWARDEKVVNDININKRNSKYLKEVKLPEGISAYTNMRDAIEGADVVVLGTPSHVIKEVSEKLKDIINKDAIVVNIAKGIEQNSLKRLSQVIQEELPNNKVVVLSGPSHAEEVAVNIPTTLVSSSFDEESAKVIQDLFMTDRIRVYTNTDLVGVEIGGAVKNIIALAAGILDGIGYGDNTKAALMTRGMTEIARVGMRMGGKPETFYGLTGMGDLIVTCTSMHSRNRRAGILIGKGYTMEEASKEVGMVVEGMKACKAFHLLSEKLNEDMPITKTLYYVLFENKNLDEAVHELMTRDKKQEIY
ncbi:glycerol 3-phosphate dehydrogenase (NAD(P)+) [Clostridium collagenovorans DSM 3089]|uniref:Glycerol-3-phosphate dehydrogenase [NAD(P)+] n=1 Tax=Clostridium collagenovorans DSM 3089 TaxID=1121306 RepID=A0A1M5SRK3_9CLOT|nr:NAD(P)H-dependent glycerol-3-phosphate dehydrogenase [Clostridium collagenovorans]SHH40958.1 glycerol 3-phosphate dehydrogenase (NAD(P)+) [Clostridium collagenovorans DSM 3089]